MNYPVSEKKCARCSACQLVIKDISGAPLEEKKCIISVSQWQRATAGNRRKSNGESLLQHQ